MSHYLEARKSLGLSREKLSGLAKRAGINVSPVAIMRLEKEGDKAIGSRGLGPDVIAWMNYILGVGEFQPTNWNGVEKSAPVVVAGEKGSFSFVSVDENGSVTVFSDKFRMFHADRVRLVAPTALPPVESAAMFETRTRGSGGKYAQGVMERIMANPDHPHSIGALAYSLGWENALVSRTVAGLIKSGKLVKVGRGVVTLPATTEF